MHVGMLGYKCAVALFWCGDEEMFEVSRLVKADGIYALGSELGRPGTDKL